MVITYHGDNFFKVVSGQITLAVDATSDRLKPTLSLKTITPSDASIFSSSEVITSPGEFELGGIHINGLQVIPESTPKFIKTIFLVKGIEEFRLAFLGHLSDELPSSLIEELGSVDILFLPVGQPPYLAPEVAAKIAKQIEPQLIIPAPHKPADLDKFVKELGQTVQSDNKLTLKYKDLPTKPLQIISLSKS